MQSLFDEIKNPFFSLMCRLVNEIHDGKKLTRQEIKNRIRNLPDFFYNEAPDFEREEKIIDALFYFDEKNKFAKNYIDAQISAQVTDTELSWLKTFLLNAETAFLLPENLREKLLERLKNIKPLYEKNFWRKFTSKSLKTYTGVTFSENLSLIIQALIEQKLISCNDKILIPYRLEYDNFTDKYFLIIWNGDKSCVEKISVANLQKMTLKK